MQSKTVNCNLKVSIYIFLQQYFDLGKNNFLIGHMVKFSLLSYPAVLTGSPITSICAPLHGGASDCVHARHLKCVTEALCSSARQHMRHDVDTLPAVCSQGLQACLTHPASQKQMMNAAALCFVTAPRA